MLHDATYMCNVKIIQMNLYTKQNRSTDIEKKLMVTEGQGEAGDG